MPAKTESGYQISMLNRSLPDLPGFASNERSASRNIRFSNLRELFPVVDVFVERDD